MSKKKTEDSSPFPRKVRDNVEAAAMAILMAIGLKYFLVEAFEIPTPSMQPALMGSKDTGIHDRILVNKAAYLLRQPPRRWDIAVFRYPHNQSQNYVKRIVGLPGERLRLVHGDVFQVQDNGNKPPSYKIIRKPPKLQGHLWKQMYELANDGKLDRTFYFRSAKRGIWKVDGGEITIDGSGDRGARTLFMPEDEPFDHYRHGYPELKGLSQETGRNLVSDLRWTLTVVPGDELQTFVMWYKERPAQGRPRAACLRLQSAGDGKATATVEYYADTRALDRGNGSTAPTHVQRVDGISVAAGSSLDLVFANYDDRLAAVVDGTEIPFVEYDARPDQIGLVELALECKGKARITDTTLARDLFYEPDRRWRDKVYEIPEDHYWMLGDNQKKSEDGRSWRALRVWVDGDKLAPAGTGRMLEGNSRYFYNPAMGGLDPDENPVFVPTHGKLVFTDKFGEEHVLTATHEEFSARLEEYTFSDGATRFVPERFMVGRAFATFWPANPFGAWFRVGLIR